MFGYFLYGEGVGGVAQPWSVAFAFPNVESVEGQCPQKQNISWGMASLRVTDWNFAWGINMALDLMTTTQKRRRKAVLNNLNQWAMTL